MIFLVIYDDGDHSFIDADTWAAAIREIGATAISVVVIPDETDTDEANDILNRAFVPGSRRPTSLGEEYGDPGIDTARAKGGA